MGIFQQSVQLRSPGQSGAERVLTSLDQLTDSDGADPNHTAVREQQPSDTSPECRLYVRMATTRLKRCSSGPGLPILRFETALFGNVE
jgi:hypothetical protein